MEANSSDWRRYMMGTREQANKIMDEANRTKLSPEARRALAEAQERRAEREKREAEAERAREINGRKGPDPVRYGDWEAKGIAYDF